jgi:hypothetical protein
VEIFLSNEAVLWLGGEALVEGSLTDCVRSWDRLSREARGRSYIQLKKPMGQKVVFRPNEPYRIAAQANRPALN